MTANHDTYGSLLSGHSREGRLYRAVADSADVECLACAHGCRIQPGGHGICAVRFNRDGTLRVPWGYASSIACDPIEKKPFYHFLPGTDALSFGMLGCNFRCPFCQNWQISQALRDPEAVVHPRVCSAQELVQAGIRQRARSVAGTYNEPIITSEWAVEVFRVAREHDLRTCMVSNGFASEDALAFLTPWLDAMNVDLKCFSDAGYRWLGGRLEPVLETIKGLWGAGKWVEVITLVVPEFNDSDGELRDIAEFLAGVSVDVPWHVSAYHRDYRMSRGPARTPAGTLKRAMRIGHEAGLRYVYAGNVSPGGQGTETVCPSCGKVLVERSGFGIRRCSVTSSGVCPQCGCRIAGVWG